MNFKIKDIPKIIIDNKWIPYALVLFISVVISLQNIHLGTKFFWGGNYTHYNNFVIFKNSFKHLIENQNLYAYYSKEYADLYKYSPTFAVFMWIFNSLPDSVGLIIWNLVNLFVLFYAILSFNSISQDKKLILLLYFILESILSTQNSQSNCLLAGLTIISFNAFEKGKNIQGTFFVVLGTFIKIYSVLGCLLFLIYPQKLKSIISASIWFVLFLLLPLIFIDFSKLQWQYLNWIDLLKSDQSASIGMSIYAYTKPIFSLDYFKTITLGMGLIILLTPLLKIKSYSNPTFRTQYLSLVLLWMVVFNHKAESPTYIIAMAAIGIWLFASGQNSSKLILAVLALIFTSIWCTDIVPHSIKSNLISLNFIKSFFPITILIYIYFDLILSHDENNKENLITNPGPLL